MKNTTRFKNGDAVTFNGTIFEIVSHNLRSGVLVLVDEVGQVETTADQVELVEARPYGYTTAPMFGGRCVDCGGDSGYHTLSCMLVS